MFPDTLSVPAFAAGPRRPIPALAVALPGALVDAGKRMALFSAAFAWPLPL